MIQLWLDDIHSPEASPIPLDNPLWIKSGTGFIDHLELMVLNNTEGIIDTICFDNDLGSDSVSGVHCFNYVEQLLYDGKLKSLRTILVHSDNSSAVNTMLSAKEIFKDKYDIKIIRLRRVTD